MLRRIAPAGERGRKGEVAGRDILDRGGLRQAGCIKPRAQRAIDRMAEDVVRSHRIGLRLRQALQDSIRCHSAKAARITILRNQTCGLRRIGRERGARRVPDRSN